MRQLGDLNCKGKRVLIRADLNVPLNEKLEITDDNRIKQFLPTLQAVLSQGGRAIIMSHLGEPTGVDAALSLKPVAARLAELLSTDIISAPDCIGPDVTKLVAELKDGQVLLLENLRFQAGEKKNDPGFAAQLAKLGDVFISDAFATAHRSHASIVGVPKLFKEKSAGLLMQKEIDYYKQALEKPRKPLCVVIGGSKVSSKLTALVNLASKADTLIIGGAMANTFLAAQGLQVGRSLFESDLAGKALELLGTLARRGCRVYLPVDVIVAPSLNSKGFGRAVPVQEIPADTMALDIGPATSLLYREALHSAETIVWNGPMGAYENEDFAKGTHDMCESIANSHGMTVVGGGDTDAAIHHMQLAHKFSFISTAGGAFLALLEGNSLPGIKALE
ncbi:MAG: phosphoglycerate kinase [Proteobacteria bacterium]|nr:phosphoglycerate kinase [Pseudomonadota bacterium]